MVEKGSEAWLQEQGCPGFRIAVRTLAEHGVYGAAQDG